MWKRFVMLAICAVAVTDCGDPPGRGGNAGSGGNAVDRQGAPLRRGGGGAAGGRQGDASARAGSGSSNDGADTLPAGPRLPVEHWGRMVSSSFRAEQQGGLGMLGQYGDEAIPFIPAITRHLNGRDDSLGFTAAWALAHIGPESQEPLVLALKNRSPNVRRRAAYGLGEMGPIASGAVAELTSLASSDSVVDVRHMAQWAVDRIGTRRVLADPDLLLTEGLLDSDPETRVLAIRRLGASHPSNRMAATTLVRLLDDSSEVIRHAAVEALVAKGRPALPAITTALRSPRPLVRHGAMLALIRIQRSF